MNAINIVIVSSCFGILVGFIAGIGYMMFGKNGWLEIRAGLKAERDESERLRELISKRPKITINGVKLVDRFSNISIINEKYRPASDGTTLSEEATPLSADQGTQGGASGIPGHVDARTSFAWVCAKHGHKFTHEVLPRRCHFCGLREEGA